MSAYLAGKVAQQQASALLDPLLKDDDSDTDASSGSDDSQGSTEKVKQTPLQKMKATAVYFGTAGGTAAGVAAAVLFPSTATIVMAAVAAFNAPYVVVKQHKIAAMPALRALNNKLREDANRLESAVDDLADEIDQLGPEADRAAAVEEELRGIADAQGANVEKLVELVQENGQILAKMRDNLRQRIVQDIIHIVVKSDRDNDEMIDRKEAVRLALRIQISLQEYGVLFDADKFLRAIGGDTTVSAIIAIVQKLLPREERNNDGSSSEEYDSDDEDDVFDMFHMAEEGAEDGGKGVSLMRCDKKPKRTSPRRRRRVEEEEESSGEEDSEEEGDFESGNSSSDGDY